MAKQTGLGANLFLGSYDLSGDVGAVDTIAAPRGSLDITGINKAAAERILTHRNGMLGFTGFWNATASQIVDALNNMPTTDLLATVAIPATFGAFAVGDVAASVNGKQIGLDSSSGQDGSLGVSTQVAANGYPLEWGQLLTVGLETFATGTVSGTSIDFGDTSTLFGAAAYLHVISHGSGTATFTIQDSADNSSFAAVTGMAFTNVTAATSERIQGTTSATVRRYVRVQKTGVSTATVAVINFVRYLTSQAI